MRCVRMSQGRATHRPACGWRANPYRSGLRVHWHDGWPICRRQRRLREEICCEKRWRSGATMARPARLVRSGQPRQGRPDHRADRAYGVRGAAGRYHVRRRAPRADLRARRCASARSAGGWCVGPAWSRGGPWCLPARRKHGGPLLRRHHRAARRAFLGPRECQGDHDRGDVERIYDFRLGILAHPCLGCCCASCRSIPVIGAVAMGIAGL